MWPTKPAKTIAGYSINTGTGELAALSGFPLSTGSSPEAVTVDPAGRYLYAANVISANELTSFSITPSTGAVTRASSVAVGTFPLCVVIDPSGQFAYVANEDAGTVSVLSIDSVTGALAAVGTFAAGSQPRSIAID